MKDIRKQYEIVTTGNKYDLSKAGEHTMSIIYSGIKANKMPETERMYVEANHIGCCLHYAMYLVSLLHEAGIKCYFTITPEADGGNHCSVLYFNEKGDKVIADPVMDIKAGTVDKHMCIPYDEFVENAIRHEISHYDVYGINGKEAFFNEFLFNCKCKLQ